MYSQLYVTPSLTTSRLQTRGALFLDRDGVLLNVREGSYVLSPQEIRWIPGSVHALKTLSSYDIPILVITNQQCIGLGLLDHDGIISIHSEMNIECEGAITGFYYCPHKKEDDCACRKPKVGLLEYAMRNHMIDPYKSLYIGDTWSDMLLAERANVQFAMVLSGLTRDPIPNVVHVFKNLEHSLPFIIRWFVGML